MAEDNLMYERLVEKALRGVVRDVLEQASRVGLLGAQHFYITFRTRAVGVRLPDWLLASHPEEMSIVLQYQFWDLVISELGFSVTLSFGGRPENLFVPYGAITGFSDPSAKFGLQFVYAFDEDLDEEGPDNEGSVDGEPADGEHGPDAGKVVTLDAFRKK